MVHKYIPPELAKVTWMKIPGFSTYVIDETTSHIDRVIGKDELYISNPSE